MCLRKIGVTAWVYLALSRRLDLCTNILSTAISEIQMIEKIVLV